MEWQNRVPPPPTSPDVVGTGSSGCVEYRIPTHCV